MPLPRAHPAQTLGSWLCESPGGAPLVEMYLQQTPADPDAPPPLPPLPPHFDASLSTGGAMGNGGLDAGGGLGGGLGGGFGGSALQRRAKTFCSCTFWCMN